MRHRLIFGSALLLALAGCGQKEAPVQSADVKAMMAQKVQPASQTYWNAVQFVSDENGTGEVVPQNEAEWAAVVQGAAQLKQLGEDLKRPEYAANRGSDWLDFAQGLVDVAGQAELAAKSKDPDQVLEVGGTLYNVCSACHEVYMPGPIRLAPTGPAEDAPAQ
ncbi:MAG: hypothetical protein U9R73_03880 [Pseudomonadota bacterium]|jgi:hypothetical protein|nr:hypothetical protein [Pseudomonadota bacterium]